MIINPDHFRKLLYYKELLIFLRFDTTKKILFLVSVVKKR